MNLDSVISRLVSEKHWTHSRAKRVSREYVKFFYGEEHVPTQSVDEFWHMHITDTKKYARDCQRELGCFLHHVPTVKGRCRKSHSARCRKAAA